MRLRPPQGRRTTFRGSSVVERLAVKGSFPKEFGNEERGELLEAQTRKMWVISSQAPKLGEGSETIPQGSTVPLQRDGKRLAPRTGDDIVHPSSNRGINVTSWS